MNDRWFISLLLAGTALTFMLAIWKAFVTRRNNRNSENLIGVCYKPSFISRLSWWAIPYPLFIAIAIIYVPQIIR